MIKLHKLLLDAGLPITGIYEQNEQIGTRDFLTPEQQVQFEQIVAQWRLDRPAMIADEALSEQIAQDAESQALAVPGWAGWRESQALEWYTDHIVTPLNAGLPATINATTNRAVLVALIAILKDMGIMMWALARMVIALRNRQWPNLQERE